MHSQIPELAKALVVVEMMVHGVGFVAMVLIILMHECSWELLSCTNQAYRE